MLQIFQPNQTFTTDEVAFNYGIRRATLQNHKLNNSDELIENIHYFYVLEQTKGGTQRIIRWTLEGVYMLGFFIKSKEAKTYRKKVAEFLRICDEARQKKFNEARQTIASQCDKILSLEAIAISKQRHFNQQINGYKSQLLQKDSTIESLKDKISNKDDAYKKLECYFKRFDEEMKRLIDENRLKKPKFQVDKYDFDEFINLFINYGNKYLFESNFIKLKAIKDILDAR